MLAEPKECYLIVPNPAIRSFGGEIFTHSSFSMEWKEFWLEYCQTNFWLHLEYITKLGFVAPAGLMLLMIETKRFYETIMQ